VPDVLKALSEVSNEDITRLITSPYILYVEGESDERILRAWADQCGAQLAMDKVSFKTMDGGTKANMKDQADKHFAALKQIIPEVKRLMLFDFDTEDGAFHPGADNPALFEWTRKNIENYLLVPDAWRRAALRYMKSSEDELFAVPILAIIDSFFNDQNLTLPPGKTWENVTANIFSVVNGKRILFENDDSLFHQLRTNPTSVELIRESVALGMKLDEVHTDVRRFLAHLADLTNT